MARGMKVMVDPAFPDHRKVRALGRALKIHPMQALGHVVALWCRVMKEAPLGNIRNWSPDDIADAAKWDGDPSVLVDAMRSKDIKFLDRYQVHDWIEEQGDVVAKRESWRTRKARERTKEELKPNAPSEMSRVTGEGVTRDMSVTSRDVTRESRAPVPFPSVPVPSVPFPTVPERDGGAEPPLPPPASDVGFLAPVQAVADANGREDNPAPIERCDDVLRQLLQKAERVTQMPNKKQTLIRYLQAARVRHGAGEVEAWLMDPSNKGADVLVLGTSLEERKRSKDRIF